MRPTTSPRRTSSGSKSAVCPVWRQRPIGLPGPAEGSGRSARPTRAQLEQLAGLPWAQQLASGRPTDADFPFLKHQDKAASLDREDKPAASAAARAYSAAQPLQWDVFPRPYVLSSLPHRDVTMQACPAPDGLLVSR